MKSYVLIFLVAASAYREAWCEVAAASAATQDTTVPATDAGVGAGPEGSEGSGWTDIVGCFKTETPNRCLRARSLRALKQWSAEVVRVSRKDPDTADDSLSAGDLVEEIGQLLTFGISKFFHNEFEPTSAVTSPVTSDAKSATGNPSIEEGELQVGFTYRFHEDNAVDESGRGHHKKKKIQKEIKKFVLKILIGIFLIKQKIKMLLMMLQTLLMSKFLIVATIYALSSTFKIWYDIKHSKHDNKVIYYENAHHQHHYEPPDHSEYEDHHGGWGGIWGRSIAVTEPSPIIEHGIHYPRSFSLTQSDYSPQSAHGLAYSQQKPS